MKIAVTTKFNRLCEDFNDSHELSVYTVNNSGIEDHLERIELPPDRKNLAEYLQKKSIDCFISGKTPKDLAESLRKKRIITITGAPPGPARMLVEIYALQQDQYIQGV